MSEAQAIETDIKTEEGEPDLSQEVVKLESEITLEVVDDDGEAPKTEVKTDGPIEIEVDGGEKPAPRRLSRTTKRIVKAQDGEAQAKQEAESLREQIKLYQLRDQQAKQTLEEPNEETFEGSDVEYKSALKAYNRQEIKRIASEEAQTLVTQAVQQNTQANVNGQQDSVINKHYERAESMNVANYHELEGSAADVMGDDFVRAIILNSDNAHRIIASLGAAPREAARIVELARTDSTRAFADALTFKIHPSLAPASLNTLDPEQTVDAGSGVAKTDTGPPGAKFW